MTRKLPPTASFAEAAGGDRLYAPSAERNAAPIAQLLALVAPRTGRALEIASGTGQHVVVFAETLPGLTWQPTEPDPARRASIDAHAAEAGLDSIRAAQPLDACTAGWSGDWPGQDLIVLSNLLHLVSQPEALTLLSEAAQALAPGGVFVIYGPFRRDGKLTSEGDETFDGQLREADPAIGYKNDAEIREALTEAGLEILRQVEMPANNLALVARRGA
ncbi:DUF938 domain-containing protein [Marinibacterium profundimaris]|uniref:Methyltransferase n=1 Tax=Marinibacterium profundimaris TaxID=1679460 RepID=A0A225NDL2_9RHOB|nr:DUF938 domain-containing protein [Marinibacterium profundimaris]OWU70370.1 methyltransferase [Marinibacterium profundimaris]